MVVELMVVILININAIVMNAQNHNKPSLRPHDDPVYVSDHNYNSPSSLTIISSGGDFTIIKVPKVISTSYCLGVATGACVTYVEVPPIFTLCSAIITQNCMKLFSVSIYHCSLACLNSITYTTTRSLSIST